MSGWLALGFLLGLFVGLVLWRVFAGRRQKGYLALTEYWVYVRTPRVPPTEQIMTRMIGSNPHNRKGAPCITSREGAIFSDIRLRISAVLKRKNPHAFRPDLFDDEIMPTRELLEGLSEADGLIRLLYASQVPLKDSRHLQFMPHLADAVSDLCGGIVILDRVSHECLTSQALKERLSGSLTAERPDFHVRVTWKKADDGWVARTHGLAKIGRPEWQSEPQEPDMETLTVGLLLNAAHKVFRSPDEKGPFSMEAFGGRFHMYLLDQFHDGRQIARLTREASA